MRRASLLLSFVLFSPFALAESNAKFTDAGVDGFTDGVKSISTQTKILSPLPRQPDGPTIIYPIWCELCEYDQDGNVLRRGQELKTGFSGETTRYIRDENGKLRQQVTENEKGEIQRGVMFGEMGKTEEEFYQHGSLHDRNTYRYDQNGNLIELLTFNSEGVQTASTTAIFDEHGNVTEQFDRGPNNAFRLHFTQTFDSETGIQTFTNFNEDGTVRLIFTAKQNKVTTYWQQPSDKREYGDSVCFHPEPKDAECESRQPNGILWHTRTTFADERRRNPTRIELRDEADQVQMAADYEYEFDGHRNWTKRVVWVWTSDSGERRLHEVDTRTITYWK